MQSWYHEFVVVEIGQFDLHSEHNDGQAPIK